MKATTIAAHADYRRDDYFFPRVSPDKSPLTDRKPPVEVWPFLAAIVNLALAIGDRKIGRGS
ncbi:MAG: hypothetical protein KGL39_04800 [Patescibacteria group bacterium]|nr:hypothetical protein [Patescibacteria group bacterium]